MLGVQPLKRSSARVFKKWEGGVRHGGASSAVGRGEGGSVRRGREITLTVHEKKEGL